MEAYLRSTEEYQEFRGKTKKTIERWLNLFAHLDDDIRIATTNITNGEVDAAFDANPEQT